MKRRADPSKERPSKKPKIDSVAEEPKKKRTKSMPVEMSSKNPVSRDRDFMKVEKKKFRDPRFDNLSGKFEDHWFQKSYGFIDEIKGQEVQFLKQQVQSEEVDDREKHKFQKALSVMTEQQKAAQRKKETQKLKQILRKKEAEAVAQGKKPFYFGHTAVKDADLKQKFSVLKETGQLDNYMKKKRREQSSKQHTMIPHQRKSF